MSMTFLNQQSLLSILVGDSNEGSTDAFPTATRKLFINRGELQFAKDTKMLREKATGSISSGSLAVPSDWLKTVALIVNNKVLANDREIDIRDYSRWYSSGNATPAYFMSEESGTRYFKFFPSTSSQSYTLYYIKKPTTALSSDSDESLFPDEFREASVYWAAGELLQQQAKNSIADKYKAVYNKFVRDGIDYAESMYVSRMYPNVDTNTIDTGETDVVGGGFDYA